MVRSLREFLRGLLTVHYGSCAGDPIAWEKDLKRRQREAEAQASRTATGQRQERRELIAD